MNEFSCYGCEDGVSSSKIFSLGEYAPYEPGYGHTFNGLHPVNMAGPLMGKPVARPYPSAEPLPIGSIPATYNRGEGNPKPFISLPTFNAFSMTGDPATFNPLSNFSKTGDPATFNPVSAMPSPSNPMGDLNPVGESLPANIGNPYRVGGEAVGGAVEPLGSYFDDQPYTSETRL